MHGICRIYDFKLFKACRFLTIFCRYFELYIYGTLFIGKEARASMSPSVSHLIFLISIAHTSVLLSEIAPSILAASTSSRMYVSTFLP